ncbi:MAG: aldehyde dehydrogenase family protein [Candidatus Coatesbacteria bacterium]|nr:aldehyde dehydrogenase family protein [Candidatus Coatesbacteria bacterium]
MPVECKNYINGQWVDSVSGRTYENRNPANPDDLIATHQKSNAEDVDRAMKAARAAQKKWALVPAPKRGEILFKVGDILRRRKEEIARDMTREMGKVIAETRGDVQEAIDMAFYAAGEGRRCFGQTVPAEMPDKFAMSIRSPIGVISAITPWNFPIAIPSWKSLPAIVVGNAVVIKPATLTPLSVIHFAEVYEEAGLPPGVFNVVTGSGAEIGDEMVTHKEINLISFTGSTEIGTDISVKAAKGMKRVCLEMGGKNAIMVMEDAKLDLALEGAVWGGFGTTGQRCTATSRVIVHRKVAQEFADRFVAMTKKLKLGDGLDPSVQVGPTVSESQLKSVHSYVEIGKAEGAELLTGGKRCTAPGCEKGSFYEPTIFYNVKRDMRIAREEIFGPVVSVIVVDDLAEAIDICNDTAYGLSGAIYTQDVNNAFVAMREVHTGIFYVNAPTIGAEIQLPFGGTKGTGNGHREAGTAALDVFCEWKAVYVDFSGKLQRAQIDDFEN